MTAGALFAPIAARGAEAQQEQTLPLYSPPLFQVGPLIVTSSMVVTWIVAIGIIIFAQIATRNMKEVPEGAQNFW